ncbi:hypothetical protein SAY87_027739 [Trapa incisa]|uniref:Vacuolar protein-sorting-associated protein 36 n=1 Tax=Trapa incisa TaxID=236973 RepID=A0AAN7PR10_9MYRT|nr:hypothetical protein SAY87_027739 [Trapa incisa]
MTVVMMRRGDVETFVGKFLESWRVRAWERECEEAGSSVSLGSSIRSASGTGGFDSSGMRVVGVARIIRREQEIWESTDKSLQQQHSWTELESKAQEMVMLADKMKLKFLSGSSQNKPANDEEIGSKEEMQDWFLRIGIISPVTRESAGALYHQQLARQLADFVRFPLER